MDRDILDNDLIAEHENNFRPAIWNWVAVILLWLGLLSCILFGLHTLRVFAAIILLSALSIFFWKNYHSGVKWIFAVIVAGVIDILTFFPVEYSIGFQFNNFGITYTSFFYLLGLFIFM